MPIEDGPVKRPRCFYVELEIHCGVFLLKVGWYFLVDEVGWVRVEKAGFRNQSFVL